MAYRASTALRNSTNVRIQSPLDPWPVPPRNNRAPRVALALWAAVVADASLEGVFARLEPEACGALAIFVTIFALVAACCDAELRQALDALPHKLASALMLDAAILSAIALASDVATPWTSLLPAMALLVVLPVAIVLHAALLRVPRLRRAPGASPGAKRAAT